MLPENATHFFNGVFFQFVPAIDYRALEELAQFARAGGREPLYEGAVHALQKAQWAHIAGSEAIALDEFLVSDYRPGLLSAKTAGPQVQHAKAMFELVAHAKSALDNLAICLKAVFCLDENGGNLDFKRPQFRASVSQHAPELGAELSTLEPWLDNGRRNTENICAVRDYWLHVGSPVIPQIIPPGSLGSLPIPRRIPAPPLESQLTDMDGGFWRTDAFVDFHLSRLDRMCNGVIRACIALEARSWPNLAIAHSDQQILFLPFLVTMPTEIHGFQVGEHALPE